MNGRVPWATAFPSYNLLSSLLHTDCLCPLYDPSLLRARLANAVPSTGLCLTDPGEWCSLFYDLWFST